MASGQPWTSTSIYFHDNAHPNVMIPSAETFETVRNALLILQDAKHRENASKKMLMFEQFEERRGSCLGGDYVVSTQKLGKKGRTVCFYVRQLEGFSQEEFVLVCRIW